MDTPTVRNVETDHARAASREAERDIPRAAREIERLGAGPGIREAHELPLPSPVLAVRQEDGDEIVAGRDGGEKAPDVGTPGTAASRRRMRGVRHRGAWDSFVHYSTRIVPRIIPKCGVHM